MKRGLILSLSLLLIGTACAPALSEASASTSAPKDKLAEILARGTLIIATDPNYAPQSQLLPDTTPDPNTKCNSTEYTANQMSGFDIAVAVEVAHRLGVEPCFVTPPWSQLVAGHWGNNWDIHVGSVALTYERMKVLYFSQPYYATPTVLLVNKANEVFTRPQDLSGKRIGVCVGCTFEDYLRGTLQIPGEQIQFQIQHAQIVGYENEEPAIADLSAGDGVKLDAVLTILPLAQKAIAAGEPVKILDEPLWFAYACITLDRSSRRNGLRLLHEINAIIDDLHHAGTLQEMSLRYQGLDLTQPAAHFDLSALHQLP